MWSGDSGSVLLWSNVRAGNFTNTNTHKLDLVELGLNTHADILFKNAVSNLSIPERGG